MLAHLQVHSNFSFHAGTMHPGEIPEIVARAGMKSVALTDRNGTHALVPFYQSARRNDIRPILGVELDDPTGEYDLRATLLARDLEGLGEIHHLVTKRQIDTDFRLLEEMKPLSNHVEILSDQPRVLEELVGREGLSASLHLDPPKPRSHPGGGDGRAPARHLYRTARRLDIPVAAVRTTYFEHPEDYPLHRLLCSIGTRSTLSTTPPQALVPPTSYLHNSEAMRALYRPIPEAIYQTEAIVERCSDLELPLGVWKFPRVDLPEYQTAESWLHQRALDGFRKLYPTPDSRARRRFQHELSVINRLGFAAYLLLVHDIIQETRRRKSPCLGRGSAACSLICYCLGITHVDPLRYDLYFERFLNPERHDPPDIDLDLSWKERDQIREWIIQRHGADQVAMISVTNRYGRRSALREAARAFGLPDQPLAPDTNRSLHSAAQRLEGLPHHLGVHCAGLVISPRPLWNDLALQRSRKGLIVTQPDMHPVEALGLIKVDLLGNRSLAVLDDTTRIVTHQNGTSPDLSDHERLAQDPKTHAMLRDGHTIGCFYIESPAMRSLLRKLQVRNYLDVVAASSVIRPGVAKSGMLQAYIERTRDPSKTVFLHPKMASLLAETHGVMIYQEDVLKIAHEVGGMSLSQADTLRRAMSGKGRDRKRLASMGDFFLRACNRNHIAPSVGQEIWRQIESFAGYAFCKAHSASFARLSLQVAYLKSHYPAEFMAAVLANGGGFYERSAYISECRRLGLALRGPDVNQSEVLDTGSDGNIRLGLGAIRELNESIAHSIVTARRERSFDSIADCLTRTSLGEESAKNLARVGGFSSLDPREPACLLEIQRLFRDSTLPSRIHEPRQHNLFHPLAPKPSDSPSLPPSQSPEIEPFPPRIRALFEMEILGFPLASHPLDLLREHNQKDLIEATAMSRYRSRPVRMLGWIIASKSVPVRPNSRLMKFISCEDRSGTFEVILFPDVCERFSRTLQSRALLIEGQIEEENGSPSLIANRLTSLRTDSLLPTTTFPCPS